MASKKVDVSEAVSGDFQLDDELISKNVPPKMKRKRTPRTGHRLAITLTDQQYEALVRLAASELRDPTNMLSYMLRSRLDDILDLAPSAAE